MLHDYWMKRNHVIAEEANKYLEEKQQECEAAIAALEAQLKAKKPKKGEVVPEINKAEYKLLPKEMIIKMIQLRVQEEDCNAGVIFDQLTSEYWPDEKFAISLISEALPLQKVQVLMFNFKQEEFVGADGEKSEIEVCTNTRYARRHDPNMTGKKAAPKLEESKMIDSSERQTPKKTTVGKKMTNTTANKKENKKSTEELEIM